MAFVFSQFCSSVWNLMHIQSSHFHLFISLRLSFTVRYTSRCKAPGMFSGIYRNHTYWCVCVYVVTHVSWNIHDIWLDSEMAQQGIRGNGSTWLNLIVLEGSAGSLLGLACKSRKVSNWGDLSCYYKWEGVHPANIQICLKYPKI